MHIAGLTEALEGAHRPGHFDGVATVVGKLLLQVLPDAAYFGEKDYQQLTVVRRLVRDLDIPTRIEGVPTVREPDGLALSSRNIYLSPAERRIAPQLYGVLRDTAAAIKQHPRAIGSALERGIAALRAAGFVPDYLALRDAPDLSPMTTLDRPARLLTAARLGRTRLIDNIAVMPRLRADVSRRARVLEAADRFREDVPRQEEDDVWHEDAHRDGDKEHDIN